MIQKQAVVNIVRPSIPQDVADVKVLPVLDYPCKICPFFLQSIQARNTVASCHPTILYTSYEDGKGGGFVAAHLSPWEK